MGDMCSYRIFAQAYRRQVWRTVPSAVLPLVGTAAPMHAIVLVLSVEDGHDEQSHWRAA